MIIRAALCLFSLVVFSASGYDIACNLAGNADFATDLKWKNAIMSARHWRPSISTSREWTGGDIDVRLPLDENGYPLELPTTDGVSGSWRWRSIILTDIPMDAYPFGTFTVLFEGTGKILLEWDAGGIEFTGDGGENRFEYTINTIPDPNTTLSNYLIQPRSKGTIVSILESKKGDHVRNLRIIMPDENGSTSFVSTYEKQPFNPAFLKTIRPFSTIRMMNMTSANSNRDSLWSQRVLPTALFQGEPAPYVYPEKGVTAKDKYNREVAYEYLVDMCNILHRNLWINVPVRANDEYRRELAKLIRDRLKPSLKVYVEHGNETWNGIFVGLPYHIELGEKNPYLPDKNSYFNAWAYHTKLSVQCFEAFESVFAQKGQQNQIISVLAGHHNGNADNQVIIEALQNSAINPDNYKPDFFSTTAYFDPNFSDEAKYVAHKAAAAAAGMGYISYEGGMGSGKGPALYDAYKRIVPQIGQYMETFQQFTAISQWGKSGHWGAMEYLGQPLSEAHKYRALIDMIKDIGQYDAAADAGWDPDKAATGISYTPVHADGLQPSHSITLTGKRITCVFDGAAKTLRLISPLGKTVRQKRIVGKTATLSTHALTPGMYLVTVDRRNVTRVIIK